MLADCGARMAGSNMPEIRVHPWVRTSDLCPLTSQRSLLLMGPPSLPPALERISKVDPLEVKV